MISNRGSFLIDYVSVRYAPAYISCNFSKNMILLTAFCKGNLCVDDLFKLKRIFSVTLNIEGFFLFKLILFKRGDFKDSYMKFDSWEKSSFFNSLGTNISTILQTFFVYSCRPSQKLSRTI